MKHLKNAAIYAKAANRKATMSYPAAHLKQRLTAIHKLHDPLRVNLKLELRWAVVAVSREEARKHKVSNAILMRLCIIGYILAKPLLNSRFNVVRRC